MLESNIEDNIDDENTQLPKLDLTKEDVMDLFSKGLKDLFDGNGNINDKLSKAEEEFITS